MDTSAEVDVDRLLIFFAALWSALAGVAAALRRLRRGRRLRHGPAVRGRRRAVVGAAELLGERGDGGHGWIGRGRGPGASSWATTSRWRGGTSVGGMVAGSGAGGAATGSSAAVGAA